MVRLWLIQMFWLALALPGYALLRRWDPDSLRQGFLFGLARCYLASFSLLTPVAVLGYFFGWPVWSLSSAYVVGVLVGAVALLRDRRALLAAVRRPSALATISLILICFDLWLGLRAGAHTLGDAGYHIARVRMLLADGLSNWDPIVAPPRLDVIYHTNLYHALIAVSGQLTGSDAMIAWLATWPFAKLLVASGVGQLACCIFGSRAAAWLAGVAVLVSQCAYSALPFPNTLAPLALLPMGLCAATELWSDANTARRAPAWLAASAVALAQTHALNAIFLAMVVGPTLLAVLLMRSARRWRGASSAAGPSPRALQLGILACAASLPWLIVAGGPRLQALFQRALPALQSVAPLPQASEREEKPSQAERGTTHDPPATKRAAYKADRFRKLDNGLRVYEPDNLRGAWNANLITLLVGLCALGLRPRRQLGALTLFGAMACAWLLVPALCSLLLFVTGAPWAALRITQVLPVVFYALVPAAPLLVISRLAPAARWVGLAELPLMASALVIGGAQISHGEPWTPARLWAHALHDEARAQWETSAARQALLCGPIPEGETVMAHPRWDYGLPMLCRNFVIALAPGRGWHGLPYMSERRADVDEFFHERTSAQRRSELMRKYGARYVYTSRRIAHRIVRSSPSTSIILAEARAGAVLKIDPHTAESN